MAKKPMTKFTPCSNCKMPGKCKAAGKCLMKGMK